MYERKTREIIGYILDYHCDPAMADHNIIWIELQLIWICKYQDDQNNIPVFINQTKL